MEFFQNLDGIDIPEMRKKKNFANALWIQRNLFFRNQASQETTDLLYECAQFIREETWRRDRSS